MLLKEMHAYTDGLNVDRLVAFSAMVAFMRIQQANKGYSKRVIMDDAAKNLQKSENLFKLNRNPFRNVGSNLKRSAFKNFK
jgi:hypothetical protein